MGARWRSAASAPGSKMRGRPRVRLRRRLSFGTTDVRPAQSEFEWSGHSSISVRPLVVLSLAGRWPRHQSSSAMSMPAGAWEASEGYSLMRRTRRCCRRPGDGTAGVGPGGETLLGLFQRTPLLRDDGRLSTGYCIVTDSIAEKCEMQGIVGGFEHDGIE
jgi:hypothetical protein